MSDIAATAAVIRGGKYPFKNWTERDHAYFEFWATVMQQHGGSATLKDLEANGHLLKYETKNKNVKRSSKKAHDGGVANRLKKAGVIVASNDGNALTLTQSGWELLEDKEYVAASEANKEIERLKRLGEIAARPGQRDFSRDIRTIYRNKCAVTGCTTSAALEAAHIRTQKSLDINHLDNGILLRADIHSLFDRGLIALTADGYRLELSKKLNDPTYHFLRNIHVFRPDRNAPSTSNIAHHRIQFGFE